MISLFPKTPLGFGGFAQQFGESGRKGTIFNSKRPKTRVF